MNRFIIAASIFIFILSGCQRAPAAAEIPNQAATVSHISTATTTSLPPTLTPVPPTATSTTPPNGIRGTVKYTGMNTGSILVFVGTLANSVPAGSDNTKSFPDVSGGEFGWSLPAGSYYVSAIMQVVGGTGLDFPFITCGPIEVTSNILVEIKIALTDATLYGKPRDCPIQTP